MVDAIGSIIPRLAELLNKEYMLQKGVKHSIDSLMKHVRFILAHLEELHKVPPDQLDGPKRQWVILARELLYDIEDVLDTFAVRVVGPGQEPDVGFLKKMTCKTKDLIKKAKTRHEIAGEISGVNNGLNELKNLRDSYKVDSVPDGATSSPDPRAMALYHDMTQLVGIDKASDEVINMLSPGHDEKLKIISIVGFGGLGKTTLAKSVHDKLMKGKNFQCGAFVSVGQNPEPLEGVLVNMISRLSNKLYKAVLSSPRDRSLLIDKLRCFLKDKRYFIVIDDIWNEKDWNNIKHAFIDSNLCSRLITTTRKVHVSQACCGSDDGIYRIQPLSIDDSKVLFYRRIFHHKDGCPHELEDVSKDILKKCGGVPLAILTIASLLAKKQSIPRKLLNSKVSLESINAYLHDLEKLKETSETTGIFVNKIRHLAFRIEDVVDEFTNKLEDDKHHEAFSTKMRKRIRRVSIWSRLSLELRSINNELEDAIRRREMLQAMIIVPVWGMGGAGKTTLVHQVYKAVKEDFDSAAWVTVSKSCKVADLLANIAREFGISGDARNMELIRLVEVICNYLKGKRYILVLDDVWEKDPWINIMDVFPTNCMSQFVLTSRKYEVASLATSNCTIKLEPLEENLSWKLFCNVAFRDDIDKKCPSDLQDLPAKFLQKCEGLPLAIACIGRLLSSKPPTYTAWKNMYKELQLQSTKNVIPGVDMILKVSLEDLPYELKNCFLHCAMFPEDYQIKRRRLIRHWITAGFIKEKESQTLEQVAEGYLNELVNRSLLQVVKTNEFGRVKCCRMHDVVRSIALDKAEKECFGKIYDSSGTSCIGFTRRLSIQSTDIAMLSQSGSTHVRAIHAFTSYIDIDLLRPILSSSILLSTLDLQGQLEKKRVPHILLSWTHLRNLTRLSLLFSKLDEDSFSSLEVLHGLCFLELGNAYDGKKLHFSALSFPALQKLGIWGAPQLNRVEIEEDCPEMKHLPHGIEYLTSLEDLYLYDTAQELIQKLIRQEANECDELHVKIRHIRRVSVKSTKENTWERIRWQRSRYSQR
ncbi:hypothetical protein C2845_PM17G04000 [Panicum miliaceum]|uniref:Disease resistance protein RPM1-like n=1 Tax=Panicum miliaceum TaxID=4540 RepID=A0A3L6Q2N0_PANMI|nr:hypothetical protein C2845_PM17G04000 [Panicum miliaceum]